jgi:MFS superfamily sulfate permease-like transporter
MTQELASHGEFFTARRLMVQFGMVWTWIAIGIVAAIPLSILFLLWKVESYKRELAASVAAVRRDECVPEEDAVKDAQWNGDKAYCTDLPFEEVERRIREALDLHRLQQRAEGTR